MAISGARASFGLSAVGTHTRTKVSGTATIGQSRSEITFADADIAYSIRAVFGNASDLLALNLLTGSTSGSTAWTAGVAQAEKTTASGTITASGNATITITSSDISGGSKAISVPVLSGDTASQWAAKVRAAIDADTEVGELFTSYGTSTTIGITRNPRFTTANDTPIYFANDSGLNIAIANGTCTGINEDATSENITSGVETNGVLISDAGLDFEGRNVLASSEIKGVLIERSNGADGFGVALASTEITGLLLPSKLELIEWSSANSPDLEFYAQDFGNEITITVIGKS